jgi:hypothetical protein
MGKGTVLAQVIVAACLFTACDGGLSDAQRAWCARNSGAVASTMDNLGLLTQIEGTQSLAESKEVWPVVLADYFAGKPPLGGVDLLSDQQKQDANRGCRAAFEGR